MNRKKELLRYAFYALVVILVNVAFQTIFFRIDLTEGRNYSLSETSKNMVQELEEPLTIKVYISEDLPYPYNNIQQDLSDILEEYSINGNRNFNYDVYTIKNLDEDNSADSTEIEKDAKGYGINPVQIQKLEESELKIVSAYRGIVFIHADMIETIPAIEPDENLEYQITSTVMKMQEKTSKLLSLDEDIKVKLYLSSGILNMSEDLMKYPEALSETVDSLNKINYNRISFDWIDPDKEGNGSELAEKYGIQPFQLKDNNGNTSNLYASGVIEYKNEYRTFDALSRSLFGYSVQNPADLEDSLNGVVEKLIGVGSSIAWLADHGAIQPYSYSQQQSADPTAQAFASNLSQRYSINPVSLSSQIIPDDAGALIIVRPQPYQPFTDWELYQIDQYLMNGGSVAVFMDSYMEYYQQNDNPYQQQPPIYIPRNTGLEKLIEHYGVTIQPSYVLDENCYVQRQQGQNGITEVPIYFAPEIPQNKINTDLPFMKGINGLIMLNSSPVKISEELPEGTEAEILFSSSDDAWLMDDPKNINLYNPMMMAPPAGADSRSSYPLACMLSGEFTSYYADKDIPQMPEPEEGDESDTEEYLIAADRMSRADSIVKSTDHGKLFVFGSTMAVTDNIIDEQGASPNAVMVFNIVDEMLGKGDYAVMRGKGLNYSPLDESTPAVKTFIKTFNMVIIPVLVILAGIIIWFRWLSRQKKIAAMFREDDNE